MPVNNRKDLHFSLSKKSKEAFALFAEPTNAFTGKKPINQFFNLTIPPSLLGGYRSFLIVPVKTSSRVLVMLEQFAGVAYIAVVVSRLIGLTISRF
jgi:hypothetical protein